MSQMSTGWPYQYGPADRGNPGRVAPGQAYRQPQPPLVSRNDALAAMDASAELGPGLRGDVVDAFVADVNAKMSTAWQQDQYQRQLDERREAADRRARTRDLVICLVTAIPLTAIAGDFAGLTGLLVSWAGIAIVALSSSAMRRRGQDGGRRTGR